MNLIINGENSKCSAQTIKDLLEEKSISIQRVAVEVNLEIVKKADYPDFRLKEGDVVEIVNFVGGGQN